MTRTTTIALSLALLLNACIPALPFSQPSDATQPPNESQATEPALTATAPAATSTEPPTSTSILPSDTPQATVTLSDTAIAETDIADTMTAVQETATFTANETAGSPTASAAASSTATFEPSSNPIATETLHPRFFGTLPPAIAYGKIKLVNKAKAEVYISMQCTTVEGAITILEYPVRGSMRVSAPAGRYNYVVWVGGRQLVGFFGLGKNEELTITIFRDRVTVK